MKKLILAFSLSLVVNSILSQSPTNESKTSLECDMIIKIDGTKLHDVQVKEISDAKIKWKICDSLKTTVYTLLVEDVNLILYSDGTRVIINPKTFEQLQSVSDDPEIANKNIIVVMINGDKLTGKFVKEDDKEIIINTALEREMVLRFSRIKSLSIDTNEIEITANSSADKTSKNYSKLNNNAIYGSIGYGGFYGAASIYYERMLSQGKRISSFVKIGMGVGVSEDRSLFNLIQFGILSGSKANHFESSIGFNYFYSADLRFIPPVSMSLGYRYQKINRPFVFRTGLAWPEAAFVSFGLSF